MHTLVLLWTLFSTPFWESRPVDSWSDKELESFLTDSPWAQTAGPAPGAVVYLATARPMREAEAEAYRRARRRKPGLPTVSDPDYADFLREAGGKHIVLAIPYTNTLAFSDNAEYRRMEKETTLKVGRRKHLMTGHFPPTAADPTLRLVFPRDVQPGDKSLVFELYLPGVTGNFKLAEFRLKELVFGGRTEY